MRPSPPTTGAPPWLLRRALDALDVGVLVFGADHELLYCNRMACELFGEPLPAAVQEAFEASVIARRESGHRSAMRFEWNQRAFWLRAVHDPAPPALEVVRVREEAVRDAEAFRLLNARYAVTRREYQLLQELRSGKTNPEIALALGLARATVKNHVRRLLERFDVPNRTALVDLIEKILSRRD
jgi:DNA-binding NarL/FixJ family response regulator